MSETSKKTSRREQILIGVLTSVLLISGYLFIRGSALDREVLILEDQIGSVDKKLKRARDRLSKPIKLPEYQGKTIDNRDLKDLQSKIDVEQLSLAGSGHVFVNLQDSGSLPLLHAQITRTAERNGLLVISKRQHAGDLIQMVTPRLTGRAKNNNRPVAVNNNNLLPPAGSAQLNRPLYDLYVSGSFSALQGFMTNLGELEYTVVLTRIRINSTERTTPAGHRLLDIEMTLAL